LTKQLSALGFKIDPPILTEERPFRKAYCFDKLYPLSVQSFIISEAKEGQEVSVSLGFPLPVLVKSGFLFFDKRDNLIHNNCIEIFLLDIQCQK
jgi:hypothetical protein